MVHDSQACCAKIFDCHPNGNSMQVGRCNAEKSNGFLIQERVSARAFTALHSIADAR